MKKLISIFCVVALSLTMGITALAKENGKGKGVEKSTIVKQISQEKKAGMDALRKVAKENRDAVKAKREANNILIVKNNQLKKALREKLNAIKESGQPLDSAISDQLNTYLAELKSINSDLKLTKGIIKTLVDTNIKTAVKDQDFNGLKNTYSQVSAVQDNRNAKLTKINEILTSMLALLA